MNNRKHIYIDKRSDIHRSRSRERDAHPLSVSSVCIVLMFGFSSCPRGMGMHACSVWNTCCHLNAVRGTCRKCKCKGTWRCSMLSWCCTERYMCTNREKEKAKESGERDKGRIQGTCLEDELSVGADTLEDGHALRHPRGQLLARE